MKINFLQKKIETKISSIRSLFLQICCKLNSQKKTLRMKQSEVENLFSLSKPNRTKG